MNGNAPTGAKGRITLLAVCGCVLIAAAALVNTPLLRGRYRMGLTAAEPIDNAPPIVVFSTVILGGFRGIIADVLWLRISYLQEQGRIFELVQLADWVTKLEPRNTEIWAFHAWNMAYNVSVMMQDDADRWRWVGRGIALLRDEGIRINPGNPHLYREIGWLYQHKLGADSDIAAAYYRKRLAENVEAALPTGRIDSERVARDAEYAGQIREKLRLDPVLMHAIDVEFGPLDWRVPFAHSLYWAYAGKRRAREKIPIEILRMISQSMAALYQGGAFEWDEKHPDGFRFERRDDLLDRAKLCYADALRIFDDNRVFDYGMPTLMRKGIRVSYANFLSGLVRRFVAEGAEVTATAHYAELRALLPELDLPDDATAFTSEWSGPILDEMLP